MKLKTALALSMSLVIAAGTLSLFAGCGDDSGGGNKPSTDVTGTFDYEPELLSKAESPAHDYNSNLFYVNSLEFGVADPSVIYITEGKDAGWFYAYGTSDEIGGHGVQSWRSKDLSHWECMGVAFMPEYNGIWAVNCYWAPEVIYDAEEKMYFMMYGAFNLKQNNRLCLSVAVSETPDGPFKSPSTRNADGKQLSPTEPAFDVTVNNPAVKARAQEMEDQGITKFAKTHALDASPFIDPDTKEKYLYFSYYDDYGEGSFVYGMKMKDWYTPDYSTLTRITHPYYRSVYDGLHGGDRLSEGSVNEGPFMMKHNGKYYLTLSIFGYTDPNYRVIQAIADSPLGAFEKVDANDGGIVITADPALGWDHIVSAGHHSFFYVGDELFISYHTFKNRLNIQGGRALAVDRVYWAENKAGVEVMQTNGPTYSVQPLPEFISGYKNIAGEATVTANNTAEGSSTDYLVDGRVKFRERDLATEYVANAGTSTIKLEWDGYKTVRGLLVYNSWDYLYTFTAVDRVDIVYQTASGGESTLTLTNVEYDWDWFFFADFDFVRPGGSAIAEFDELPVKSITFTIRSAAGAEQLAISDIFIMGKDTPCPGVSSFKPYSYTTTSVGSSHIVNTSTNFGTVDIDGVPSALETMYGYDLSHDDGTANAYIEQKGVSDQYAYFKGIYSTQFYIEAEFTLTQHQAYPADIGGALYPNGDPYPKFGIAISCRESSPNTIFYYVDAVGFSRSVVGCAQLKMGGGSGDWDWNATEKLVDVAGGLSYIDGNKVKLAVLREGDQFWFLCNDNVMISYNQFNIFGAEQRAGVGFLTFNTPMKVMNYMATAESAAVTQKKNELKIS